MGYCGRLSGLLLCGVIKTGLSCVSGQQYTLLGYVRGKEGKKNMKINTNTYRIIINLLNYFNHFCTAFIKTMNVKFIIYHMWLSANNYISRTSVNFATHPTGVCFHLHYELEYVYIAAKSYSKDVYYFSVDCKVAAVILK
jgi:hypothetical protein